MRKTAVIFNPTAGQGRADRHWPELKQYIGYNGHVRWFRTRRAGDGARLACEAASSGSELIIAAGGDGTVNEVVNGMMRANGKAAGSPILAILPLGSANDFAAGLKILNLEDGLDRLSAGRPRYVDVGCVRSGTGPTSYFCFSGGVGFLAAVAIERNKIRHVRGPWLYLLAALGSMKHNRAPIKMRIEFDRGRTIEQEVLLLGVNNTPTVGGFPLTPSAKMDDGLFDVILAEGTSLARMLRLLLEARRGTHLRFPEFQLRQARRLSIKAQKPVPVHLDGQLYCNQGDRIRMLDIWMIPQGLRVLA